MLFAFSSSFSLLDFLGSGISTAGVEGFKWLTSFLVQECPLQLVQWNAISLMRSIFSFGGGEGVLGRVEYVSFHETYFCRILNFHQNFYSSLFITRPLRDASSFQVPLLSLRSCALSILFPNISCLPLHFHMGSTADATDFRYVFSHSNGMGICSLLFPDYVVDITNCVVWWVNYDFICCLLSLVSVVFVKCIERLRFRHLPFIFKESNYLTSIHKCQHLQIFRWDFHMSIR